MECMADPLHMAGSEVPNEAALSWVIAAGHARYPFLQQPHLSPPLSVTHRPRLLRRAPTCPGLVHSIQMVGHPGPVTRLLSCTKASGRGACPVPHAVLVCGGLPCRCMHCRWMPQLCCSLPSNACRCAPTCVTCTYMQEAWEALDIADRELAATLPVATHWAPSYSIHPRTGDRECLCWAGVCGCMRCGSHNA